MLVARDAGALACTSSRVCLSTKLGASRRPVAPRFARPRRVSTRASLELDPEAPATTEQALQARARAPPPAVGWSGHLRCHRFARYPHACHPQALRREVDKKEAALQVARLTLLEAERKLKQREGRAAGDACAFDVSYGWNRRFAGSYVGARPLRVCNAVAARWRARARSHAAAGAQKTTGRKAFRPRRLGPSRWVCATSPTSSRRWRSTCAASATRSSRGKRRKRCAAAAARAADRVRLTLRAVSLPQAREMRAKLDKLTLSNDAIWEREHARPQIKCVDARCTAAASRAHAYPRAGRR